MANDTIVVDPVVLRQKASELRTLATNISSRPCNITLSSCKGAFAGEMMQMVAALNDVGAALSELASSTALQIDKMCVQFQEADALASTQFSGGK